MALVRRALQSTRGLSAAAATAPAAEAFFSPGYLGGGFTATTLSNGVVVASTAPAEVSCVGVRWGAAGGFAASLMAAKSANGKTDLAIQRALELAGSTPHAFVDEVSATFAVEALPEAVDDAFAAAAVGAGVGRDALVAWEFEETKASPLAVAALQPSLAAAAVAAARGAGYAPVASAEALGAAASTDVDAWFAAAVASAPATAFGVGVPHAQLEALAKCFLGDLPARAAAPPARPKFAAGVTAVAGAAPGCALAAPAPADAALAAVVAQAVSGALVEDLVVVEAASKEAAEALLAAPMDAKVAKGLAATAVASSGPVATASYISAGVDPAALYAAILAVDDKAVADACAALAKAAPAVAVSA